MIDVARKCHDLRRRYRFSLSGLQLVQNHAAAAEAVFYDGRFKPEQPAALREGFVGVCREAYDDLVNRGVCERTGATVVRYDDGTEETVYLHRFTPEVQAFFEEVEGSAA